MGGEKKIQTSLHPHPFTFLRHSSSYSSVSFPFCQSFCHDFVVRFLCVSPTSFYSFLVAVPLIDSFCCFSSRLSCLVVLPLLLFFSSVSVPTFSLLKSKQNDKKEENRVTKDISNGSPINQPPSMDYSHLVNTTYCSATFHCVI